MNKRSKSKINKFVSIDIADNKIESQNFEPIVTIAKKEQNEEESKIKIKRKKKVIISK